MLKKSTNDDKLVKWRSFPGRLYAEMIAEVLRNNEIHCIIKGEDVGILGGSIFGSSSPGKVAIWIEEKNRDRAEEIAKDMLDKL